MPSTCRAAVRRRLAGAVIIAGSLLLSGPGTALAAYGPPPPPTGEPPVPGRFTEVVTSQTVGDAGKLITHLNLDGLDGSLYIPPGDFVVPVQITVTEPLLKESIGTTAYPAGGGPALRGECGSGAGIGDAGFHGWCAVGGAGIIVQINGADDTARFRKPMILTFDWKPKITDLVVRWNGRHFVDVRKAVTQPRDAKVRVYRDNDYLVLRRIPKPHRGFLVAQWATLTALWQQSLGAAPSLLSP
jgi:hypothetical protein